MCVVTANLHTDDNTTFRADHLRVGGEVITTLALVNPKTGEGVTVFLTDARLAKLATAIRDHLADFETEAA